MSDWGIQGPKLWQSGYMWTTCLLEHIWVSLWGVQAGPPQPVVALESGPLTRIGLEAPAPSGSKATEQPG